MVTVLVWVSTDVTEIRTQVQAKWGGDLGNTGRKRAREGDREEKEAGKEYRRQARGNCGDLEFNP